MTYTTTSTAANTTISITLCLSLVAQVPSPGIYAISISNGILLLLLLLLVCYYLDFHTTVFITTMRLQMKSETQKRMGHSVVVIIVLLSKKVVLHLCKCLSVNHRAASIHPTMIDNIGPRRNPNLVDTLQGSVQLLLLRVLLLQE